ncbi:MAG TPA: hypothetical protein VI756_09360 [Blastocatellia bacterium]
MMFSVLAAALPVLVGLIVVRLIAPRLTGRLFVVSLSVPVGYGVVSCLAFVWLLVVGSVSRGVPATEVAFVIGGAILIIRRGHQFLPPSAKRHMLDKPKLALYAERMLWVAFVVVLLLVCISYVVNVRMAPHGSFDAWESWNMKARLLFLSGRDWKHNFKAVTDIVPDYPLSLPLSIASIWATTRNDSTLVPVLVAGFYLASTVGILLAALTVLRSPGQGLIACILLLGTPFYVHLAYAEYADVPLACLMLATIALLAFYETSSRTGDILALAGLAAGLSCWMKDEGVVFCICILVSFIAFKGLLEGRATFLYTLSRLTSGAMIPWLMLVMFRAKLAGSNWFLAKQDSSIVIHKLLSADIYRAVLHSLMFHVLEDFGNWQFNILLIVAVCGLLAGIRPNGTTRAFLGAWSITVTAMLCFYVFILVASPYSEAPPPFDINWFALVTIQRLFMQLWPTFIFGCLMIVRTPEEILRGSLDATLTEPGAVAVG